MPDNPFLDGRPILFNIDEFIVIEDKFPVSKGHTIITTNIGTKQLDKHDWNLVGHLIEKIKNYLNDKYQPDGYNIGINDGEAAGQTIPIWHLHVIPRYKGDHPNSRGGVRHCIPGKGYY